MFILRWGEMSVVLQRKGHLKLSHLSGQQTIHPMRSQAGAYLLTIATPESSLSSWNLVNVSHTWRTDMKQLPQMLFHFLIHAFSFKVPSVCPPSQPLLFSYLLLNWSPSHSFTHILTWFERHWFLFSPEHSSTSAGSHLAAPPLSL